MWFMRRKSPSRDLGMRRVDLRKARGLTQQQLADQIGVTRRAIVYYEKEAENLPLTLIAPLAKALSVTIEELLGLRVPKETHTPHLASLWRRLKVLETFSEKDRKAVLHYVQTIAEMNTSHQKAVGR